MSKVFRLCLLVCCVFALTACASGSSSSWWAPDSIERPSRDQAAGGTYVRDAAGIEDVVNDAVVTTGTSTPRTQANINAFTAHLESLGGTGTVRMNLPPNGDAMAINLHREDSILTFTVEADDFVVYNNNIRAADTGNTITINQAQSSDFGNFVGTGTESGYVILGGEAVGLAYADFGYWNTVLDLHGTVDGTPYSGTSRILESFVIESASAGAYNRIAPLGNEEFTGRVVGSVYEGNRSVALQNGVAALSLTSPTTGSLGFSFDNFYSMAAVIAVDNRGAISHSTHFAFGEADKNTTGISFANTGARTTRIDGQFYGSGAVEEAAGSFAHTQGNRGIVGAFGAK